MAIPAPFQVFADAIGIPAPTMERTLAAVRAAKQVRPGSRRGHVDYGPRDYATLALGLVSPLAVEAPEVVEAFGGFTFLTAPRADEQVPRWGPGTLLDALERMIEGYARAEAAPEESTGAPIAPLPHVIHFKLSQPRKAELVWLGPGGVPERVEVYAPPHDPEPGAAVAAGAFARSVTLDTSAIIAAGRAWLGALASRGADVPPPENENAASPGREAAPTRDRNAAHDPTTSHPRIYAPAPHKKQVQRPGHSPQSNGSYTHGRKKDAATSSRPGD